ncbi:alpha-L-fucosidase-domain-containing protein [Bisporella sp. PMI_857]|nr:alpha-L-fucosidase-domain-containing protein [Bisporella sp. PMI_857]
MKSPLSLTAFLWSTRAINKATINNNDVQSRSDHGFPPRLRIHGGTLTSKWFEGSDFVQIIEMIIANDHPSNFLTLADTLNVTADSDSFDLVTPGTLTRLAPQQQAVVQIGVKNKKGVAPGTMCSATITAIWGAKYGEFQTTTQDITGMCGFGDYSATSTSLEHHWNPDWFNEVKYGIFIHWGIYSVPAFGNTTPVEDYAEWYWKRQHEPDYRTETYQYHLRTYGQDLVYDDFIANFTAVEFDAKEWVDLVADAGARYIVPVTKHHDGYALFNFSESVSRRSSIHYGPKRDLIGELFDAAKKYHPEIRRGTYFSLPEWYNPLYKHYAYTPGGGFPGGPPINPYTGKEVEYTGYVENGDFIQDIQLPQQNVLAYEYDTEIMWCDIAGSANNATIFASAWINWARDRGRQVTFNNRCGIAADFDTPEYSTNDDIVVRKWESNRGMDPFSFGYNYMTPDEEYLTGEDIVKSLIDIVSKNGNFLLDIGPKADGTIPEIMAKGLLDAGKWIMAHGESIYSTRYWATTPGKGSYRYTTKDNAFYIHVLSKPSNTIMFPDKVPYLPGDKITILGGSMSGTEVPAMWGDNGLVTIEVSDELIASDKYIWTFKLDYTSTW